MGWDILSIFGAIRKMQVVAIVAFLLPGLSACDSSMENAARAGAEAQQRLDARDLYGARVAITEAIAERDDDPQLHILRGRIELAAGRARDAFAAYSDALSLEATNPEALQAVSQLGLQTGYLREAEGAADTILSFSPEQPEALLTKGLIALVRKKHEDALGFAERILAVKPGDEAGIIIQARTLALTGETQAGLDLLLAAAENVGNTVGIDLTLIELYRELGNLEDMKATFERLVEKRPDDHRLAIDYINTLYKSGETDKARALTDKVIRADIKDKTALSVLTTRWLEYDAQPVSAETLQFLATKGSLESRVAIARYMLAVDRAEDARRILVSVASGYWVEARALYARTLQQLGERQEGLTMALDILEKDTTNADALLVKVKESIRTEDYMQATNDAQLVIRDNPLMRDGYISLIDVYLAKNDKSGASRVFKDAIGKLPQDLVLFRVYTDFLIEKNDRMRAILTAKRFAKINSASISAWQLYQQTCRRARDEICAQQAIAGENEAKTIYAIDPPPGTLPTRGLFGRLS